MKISICIPTYEMNGKGVEYLNHSLNILSNQTYRDFEVVISDQSDNLDIKNLCEKWNGNLNIKYISYKDGLRRSSSNINNAIKHASGDIIRILFQDDFLYDKQSLETELVHFLGNHNDWMVTACCHTKDGINLTNPFYPKYNDIIHYGNNTISSPSVLMLYKKSFLEFDESLLWLMDVEYYKRMFDSFGLPSICNYITVVNREHDNQVSNIHVTDEVKKYELNYINSKYKKNLNLENVTLVCVTSVNVQRAIKALQYSVKNIEFKNVLLLTSEECVLDNIDVIKINPILNTDEYSKFIVYELHKYINTEFALIIQEDGFVVNAEEWDDLFLEYDYIGAPWPIPEDDFSFKDSYGNLQRVGNGGFSLRSKKLLRLASELGLEWKSYFGFYNEDGFFCCHNKHIYEANGCKFAPIDVASKFSFETPIPENNGILTFGFHGKNHNYNNLISN